MRSAAEQMSLAVFAASSDDLASDVVRLAGDEGRHAAVVRRVRVGEQIMLTDGQGIGATCVVRTVDGGVVEAEVVSRVSEPAPSPALTVVQAIPKGDHADRAVDLLTEVGVDAIVPWSAERNVVTWRQDRRMRGVERWRAVAHAAAKQSRRLRFPEVAEPHTTAEVIELVHDASLGIVLHEGATERLAAVEPPQTGSIVVVVGPEGGISTVELDALAGAGAWAVRLGPTVLRTSSAGAAAAAVLLSRTPRWA
jgi:16S rRNA (uracil1498-N3)-methyltransferase